MKMSFTTIDHEIHELEQRIADDRVAFVAALNSCGHSVKETVSSPKALLAVAGVGFVAGKILFRPKIKVVTKEKSRTNNMLGVLTAALSLMQPGGAGNGIASWVTRQLWQRREAKRRGAARRPRADPAADEQRVVMPRNATSRTSPNAGWTGGPRAGADTTSV